MEKEEQIIDRQVQDANQKRDERLFKQMIDRKESQHHTAQNQKR